MQNYLLFLIFLTLPGLVSAESITQLKDELEKKQYATAAVTGLSLLDKQPENLQLQFFTALALQNNNQHQLAIQHYQQIIKAHPELPEPRNNLAIIYLQQGLHDKAVDLLIASLQTHPAYATVWQNLSTLYKGLASEAYRKALSEEKNTRSVVYKIELTELNSLHSSVWQAEEVSQPPHQVASISKQPEKTVEKDIAVDNIIDIVLNWANAWSEKDINVYIDAYTIEFKGKSANHNEWEKQRRERIGRPGKIKVELSEIRVKSKAESRAIIEFKQAFTSSSYSDRVLKRLHLSKVNNKWKISRESTLDIL